MRLHNLRLPPTRTGKSVSRLTVILSTAARKCTKTAGESAHLGIGGEPLARHQRRITRLNRAVRRYCRNLRAGLASPVAASADRQASSLQKQCQTDSPLG